MNKQEFLTRLNEGLTGLPQEDIQERLNFYAEMIDDRMEDGVPEEEAVSQIGSVEEIVQQTVADIPITKLVKEKISSKRKHSPGVIALLILGAPVWLPLLIAALAVLFAVYVSLWAVVISLWAVDLSFLVGGIGSVIAGIVQICRGDLLPGLATIGAGVLLAGLSILLFYGCKAVTKAFFNLNKKTVIWIKSMFIGKENAQ